MLQSLPRMPQGVEAGDTGVLHTENYGNPKEIQQSGTHPPQMQKGQPGRAPKGCCCRDQDQPEHACAPTHTWIRLHICACTGRSEASPLLQSPSTSLSCPSKHGTHQERRIRPAWSLFQCGPAILCPMNCEQVILVLSPHSLFQRALCILGQLRIMPKIDSKYILIMKH